MTTTGIRSIDKPGSLARQAYTAIRRAIQDRVLVQGELYSEGELAESLGISRTPVREALIDLSREGLVEIVRRRGSGCVSWGRSSSARCSSCRPFSSRTWSATSPSSPTPTTSRPFRGVLTRQAKHLDDPEAFLAVDEEFHLLMPQLAGLERTRGMLATLRGAMWLIGTTTLALPERSPHVLEEHTAVVDAVAAGNADEAEAAIRFHISTTSTAAGTTARAE